MKQTAARIKHRFVSAGFILCAWLVGSASALATNIHVAQVEAPSPARSLLANTRDLQQFQRLQRAADQAAHYLAQQIKADGQFEYRINLNPSITVPLRYNILRHAGAIYALSAYYQTQPDPEIKAAIDRAGGYLRDRAIAPVPGQSDMLAVWSIPEVNRSGKPLQAKLGGTGLGLVALLSIEEIEPGFVSLDDLRSLGRFILYMQKEDGSFYSKYIPSEGGRWDRWQSLYYPGEAALGLLMLYQKDNSEIWLEAAVKALTYLAHSREGSSDVPADHWALLATEQLLSLPGQEQLPVSEDLLVNHGIQICETILRSQIQSSEKPEYRGGFSVNGKTTPTATRLEGLQAALSFIPADRAIRPRIEAAVPKGLSFLLAAQVQDEAFAGAFPRAVAFLDPTASNATQFNRRATEVRIDYVQHALSAILQRLQQMENPSARSSTLMDLRLNNIPPFDKDLT